MRTTDWKAMDGLGDKVLNTSATLGRTKLFVVGGLIAAVCALVLSADATAAPANDNFADAQVINGAPVTVSGTMVAATKQANEPNHDRKESDELEATVWYSWTAPQSGTAVLDVDDDGHIGGISAYAGSSLTGLIRQGSPGYDSTAFAATGGTTYRIAIASGDRPGPFSLKLTLQQPPANDNFANAQQISGTSAFGTTLGATLEPSEPYPWENGVTASVWLEWTAPQTDTVKFNADGNGVSGIAIYTGTSLGSLVTRASGRRSTSFAATVGTTYKIAIASYAPHGSGFNLSLSYFTSPANDDFANAIVIPGGATSISGTTEGAVVEEDEPDHGSTYSVWHGGKASVWYEWTATQSGTLAIEACDLGTYRVQAIAAYTGSSVGNLARHGTAGDCRTAFPATAGTTYKIAVVSDSGYSSSSWGTFALNLELHDPPANDHFASPEVITGVPASVSGSTLGATLQANEPNHEPLRDESLGASVWYEWTALESGTVNVDACADDAVEGLAVAVYEGSEIADLVSQGSSNCQMTFAATAGTTYRIAVGSRVGYYYYKWGWGSFELELSLHQPPPNDHFADAEEIDGALASVSGTTQWATVEPDEPNHDRAWPSTSVWYRWTAPTSGSVTLDACDGEVVAIAVYTGASLAGLVGQPSGHCFVTFTATAETTYRIAVASYGHYVGDFTLDLEYLQDPPEEKCADGETGTPPNCLKPPPQKCADGETGTHPNCIKPPQQACAEGKTGIYPDCKDIVGVQPQPGRVGKVTIAKKTTVKVGKKVRIKVRVTNVGGKRLQGKIKLKSSKKQIAVPKSLAVTIPAGKQVTKTITVKASKKAKGKAKITASIGGKAAAGQVIVK